MSPFRFLRPSRRFVTSPVRAISMLAVSCGFVLAATSALAQTALDPVVVTGSREAEPLARVAGDIVVIDAQRIRDSTADSVEDLLRREAGVQLSRSGGPGKSAGVFIRGGGSNNTVVLIDGVRVGSATLGQPEFESIGLSQIERIEVLRGPGSSLYGADAMGGVIQIFTKRGSGDPRFTANAAVGGYRSAEGAAGVSGSAAAFDYAASLGYERSRGISALAPNDQFGNYNPDDDGYHRSTAQARLGYTPAAGHRIGLNVVASRLNSQYDATEFAPPDFLPDNTPDFRSKLDSTVTSLDYRGTINSLWTTSAQLAHDDDDLKSGGHVVDRFRTQRDQFTWQNALQVAAGQRVVLAYEYLNEKADTDLYDAHRRNQAFIGGYTGSFGAQLVQLDLRHDRNSAYGGQTTGRLGWSMQIVPKLRLRAVAGTSFRAPSFNELAYPDFGVSTLEPERGRSIELGATWQSDATQLAATVYRNRVRNLIGYQPLQSLCPASGGDYSFGCAANIGRATLQGATLSGSQRWGGLQLRATVDFLDAKDDATGERLARRAAHQESLAADYDVGPWSVGAALLAVGARPDGVQLGSYATLDLRARWRFAKQWQLEAKLLNATDRQYEPVRDYQSLGRQAWLGVRYDSLGL